MKDTAHAKVLLEKDGILVSEVEVKDLSTGSHFKIALTPEYVVVKVIKFGSCGRPSVGYRVLLPGENRLESAGGVRLLLQMPNGRLPFQASVPFLVTYSLKVNMSLTYINVLGDLSEEFAELRLKHGAVRARRWYWRQVLTSAYPCIHQVARQVLASISGTWIR